MVLDAGKLVEFDSPNNLLQKEGGMLKSLVDGSGDRDALYKMAAAKKPWTSLDNFDNNLGKNSVI